MNAQPRLRVFRCVAAFAVCAIIPAPQYLRIFETTVPQENLLNPAIIKRLLNQPSPGPAIGRLIGASASLSAVELAQAHNGPLLMIANDPRHADQLEAEIRWFAGAESPRAALR